jgi:hypothetical protein
METAGAADAETIRQRAYELWERDGRPEGRDTEYWLRAEAALVQEAGAGLESPPGRPAAGLAEPPASGSFGQSASPAGTAGARESSATGSAAAERVSENRADYVQQRRTRKKADT